MKIGTTLRASTSTLAAALFLASGAAWADSGADQNVTVVDGSAAVGTIVVSGLSRSIGNSDNATVYTNFFTEGGAGSGGGGGLGGVFFVDQGATLTLNNVQFKSNTVKGGEGGGVAMAALNDIVLSLPSISVDAAPVSVVSMTPTISFGEGGVFITGATLAA